MSKNKCSTEMLPLPPATPECEKMCRVREDSQKLGTFLEWLQSSHPRENVTAFNIERILAEYFEIDRDAAELEKRKLLAYQRILNARTAELHELGLETA